MDPAYTDRLESVVRKLPEAPCAVGLVVASGADWVPAAAGDLAATVSRGRAGHTILVSLASEEPDLDHELGVEPRLGLSDVLSGSASTAEGTSICPRELHLCEDGASSSPGPGKSSRMPHWPEARRF